MSTHEGQLHLSPNLQLPETRPSSENAFCASAAEGRRASRNSSNQVRHKRTLCDSSLLLERKYSSLLNKVDIGKVWRKIKLNVSKD